MEFAVCVLFVFARMNFCEDWFAGLIFRGVDQGLIRIVRGYACSVIFGC